MTSCTPRRYSVNYISAGVRALIVLLFLGILTIAQAETVSISGTETTTQILDVLYPGSGDRTAIVTSTGSVDVPASQGDGVRATLSTWSLTNDGIIRGDAGAYLALGGFVSNNGGITGRTLNQSGVFLGNGGGVNTVVNGALGTITGGTSSATGGIGVNAQSASPNSVVTNSGHIHAYGDGASSRGTAVLLNGGGTVTNQTGGVIAGGYGGTAGIGVYLFGSGTTDNSGTITGTNYAVLISNGGTVTNHVGAVITGGYGGTSGPGVYIIGTGEVENSGTVTGNNFQGVVISGNGTVTNHTGGSITANGATIGVNITPTAGNSATVTNETSANITGGRNGVVIGGSGQVTNNGTITGQDANYYGVRFSSTTAGTYSTDITNSGTISGGLAGLSTRFLPASGSSIATNSVANTGTITATGASGTGLMVEGKGTFTNTITNSGTISSARGLFIDPGATGGFTNTITNSGTIAGNTTTGIDIRGSGTITNNSGGTIAGTTSGIYVTGAGAFTNYGTITGQTGITCNATSDDTLINTGTITGTGGTAVSLGAGNDTVTLGTGTSITGTINGGDGTDAITLTGDGSIGIDQIAYFESLTKNGTGTWTLTGTGNSGGSTVVNQGELVASGTIGDSVTINTDGTLSGNGSTGSVVNSGRIAPGNSIGLLTINGNYTHQVGAVFEVEADSLGNADRINATGTATINGGTVQVLAESGSYQQNTLYTILYAAGGRTGEFTDVTSNLAFLDPNLTYDSDNVFLTLVRNQTDFSDIALTHNQRVVAGAVDEASLTATGDDQDVIDGILALSAPGARNALDQLGGAVYTAFPIVDTERTYQYVRSLCRPGHAGSSKVCTDQSNDAARGVWVNVLSGRGELDADEISSRFHHDVQGFESGVDFAKSEYGRSGISISFAHDKVDFDDLEAKGEVRKYQVALYASHERDGAYLNGALCYGFDDYGMTRQIGFDTIDRTARGSFTGREIAGYLEVGCTTAAMGFKVHPMASLFALNQCRDGFSEEGAGSASLDVSGQDSWSLKSALGFNLSKSLGKKANSKYLLDVNAMWVHEFGNNQFGTNARLNGMDADSFEVLSDTLGRDHALFGLGLTSCIGKTTQLRLAYNLGVGRDSISRNLTGGLRYKW